MRGYWGIGIYHPKRDCNVGSLLRSAHSFGASFVFTVGARYQRQASDTTDFRSHVPLFEFRDLDSMCANLPYSCLLVGIELGDGARPLPGFVHPERALYLLGAEDHGLPRSVLERCHHVVEVPHTEFCLNVSVAGSIVMYDRVVKAKRKLIGEAI